MRGMGVRARRLIRSTLRRLFGADTEHSRSSNRSMIIFAVSIFAVCVVALPAIGHQTSFATWVGEPDLSPTATSIPRTDMHPPGTSTPTSIVTTVDPTPFPTPTSVATAIPTTVDPNSALLGGMVSAFNAKFGADHCCDLMGWDTKTPLGDMWVGVDYNGATPIDFDNTSNHLVTAVGGHMYYDITTNLTPTWTLSQAEASWMSYLPPDARPVTSWKSTLPWQNTFGYERVYYSPLLSRTLPASAFRDYTGKLVKPGIIFVSYEYGQNFPGLPPAGVASWTASISEQRPSMAFESR